MNQVTLPSGTVIGVIILTNVFAIAWCISMVLWANAYSELRKCRTKLLSFENLERKKNEASRDNNKTNSK